MLLYNIDSAVSLFCEFSNMTEKFYLRSCNVLLKHYILYFKVETFKIINKFVRCLINIIEKKYIGYFLSNINL